MRKHLFRPAPKFIVMTRPIAGRWHVAAIGRGEAYLHRQSFDAFDEAARLAKTIREAVREGRGLNLAHWTPEHDGSISASA